MRLEGGAVRRKFALGYEGLFRQIRFGNDDCIVATQPQAVDATVPKRIKRSAVRLGHGPPTQYGASTCIERTRRAHFLARSINPMWMRGFPSGPGYFSNLCRLPSKGILRYNRCAGAKLALRDAEQELHDGSPADKTRRQWRGEWTDGQRPGWEPFAIQNASQEMHQVPELNNV